MSEVPDNNSRRTVLLFAVAIVVASVICYHRTLNFPFHFDGAAKIQTNEAYQTLTWADFPTTTRSLVGLSWRLNYLIDGGTLVGYHLGNIAIHITASLLLFGFIYQTLQLPKTAQRYRDHAVPLAAGVALLWAVHPLQTQSVTYIVQRYESLMGMFFLLSLFCFVRGYSSKVHWAWYVGSVIACAGSTLCKEVAVVLPLVILWYDRAFLAQSWRDLFRKRWAVYAGLFTSWLILAQVAFVPVEQHDQHGTVVVHEVDFSGDEPVRTRVGSKEYLYSQAHAIPFYIQLTILPMGQSLDHGWRATYSLTEAIWPGVLVVAALALTIGCIFRAPRWSFVSACFFLILAPTSSILPIQDIVFEHRMYLPLAAVLTLIVFGLYEGLRQMEGKPSSGSSHLSASQAMLVLLVVLVVVYGGISIARNEVYRSNESMWRDVLAKNPKNPRAWHGIAHAHIMRGEWAEAIPYIEKTIELHPEYKFKDSYSESFMGGAKKALDIGDLDMAARMLDLAIKTNPSNSEAYVQLAKVIYRQNPRKSVVLLQMALARDPDNLEAQELLNQLSP